MSERDPHRNMPSPEKQDPPDRTNAERQNQGDGTDSGGNSDWEGATEREVGDTRGPGPGYDNEPEQEPDTGGVS